MQMVVETLIIGVQEIKMIAMMLEKLVKVGVVVLEVQIVILMLAVVFLELLVVFLLFVGVILTLVLVKIKVLLIILIITLMVEIMHGFSISVVHLLNYLSFAIFLKQIQHSKFLQDVSDSCSTKIRLKIIFLSLVILLTHVMNNYVICAKFYQIAVYIQ